MPWKQKTKPALYEAPMKSRNVRLDDSTVAMGKKIGQGNLSAGIRLAVALAAKLKKTIS